MINKIILGNALNVLKTLPAESVNCCITSPPYWGLRDYGIEPVIWDEKECKHEFSISSQSPIKHKPGETNPGKEAWYKDKGGIGNPNIECEHEFNEYDSKLLHENRQNLDGGTLGNPEYRKNLHGFGNAKAGFCSKCGAWRGSLGLEPNFELYIKHLCDIFDEVKRVLRKDGVCFVNLGDSYAGSGKAGSNPEYQNRHTEFGKRSIHSERFGMPTINIGLPAKSLCLIPQRFAIEIVNRGWLLRNTIIWHKPNCMPASANDRFTIDFEYLFFFTKNNKAIFWTNEKTLECVSKKPLGNKGIEGKDWEWRPCPACSNKDYFNYRTRDVMRKENDCPQFKASNEEKENIKNKICPRCKGTKKVKHSFWAGHDYWFEQQFEPILTDSIKRELRGNRPNKYSKDGHLPKGVHPNTMSRVREYRGYDNLEEEVSNRAGRNKRCVWTIPTQPFSEAHFSVYPPALIEPMIQAGCPEFVCKKCGKARVKIYRTKVDPNKVPKKWRKTYRGKVELDGSPTKRSVSELYAESLAKEKTVEGYTDCGCNAGWESGITLDPFMGAGTTALVALKQRKRFIGIEIKQEYIDMAKRRIANVQQRIF